MSVVYFHIDTDGKAAAAIIKRADPTVYPVPVNYGYELRKDRLSQGETVYVVDFTFEPEDMLWLKENCRLIWIDHHELAINKVYEIIGEDIEGIRDSSMCGTELTWQYVYPDVPFPKSVKLIGCYDTGRFMDMPDVMEFEEGLSDMDLFPVNNNQQAFVLWNKLFDDDNFTDKTIRIGRKILSRKIRDNKILMKSRAFESTFCGYIAIVANVGLVNSMMFDSVVDPIKHDLIIGFYRHNRGYWKVSVREVDSKKNIHVGKLCERYRGGGHRGAGGYSVKHLSELEFAKDF
jgi:oligoribonuclease NrnB/cAMP/cGMP phosphodiesterase (DHH superfamily)